MKRLFGFLFIFIALGLSVTMLCSCSSNPETCEHNFGAWIVTVSPTCESFGEQQHTCSKCGKIDTRIMEKTQHDYKKVVVKEADCTNPGQINYICKYNPDHNYSETVDALGHNWITSSIIKAPTCTDNGLSGSARCDRCGLTEQAVVLPKLGHKYIEKWRTEATCEGTGVIHYECLNDNTHIKNDTIDALGHDWETGSVITEATCTTPGKATSGKCRRCQETKGIVEIPALGHDMKLIKTDPLPNSNPNESLCGGAGVQTWKCSRCPETQIKTVEGTNHKFPNSGWFYKRQATCQQTGEKYRNCSVCGYQETEIIPTIPHDFTRIEYLVTPKCEQSGTMKIKCTMCGEYETGQVLVAEPTGHDWKELGVTVQPTCQNEGHASHTCLTCHETREYTIEPCGHVYRDYTIDNGGKTMSKHCIYCGASAIDQKPIPTPANNKVEYELRLRRTNGMPYSPHKNGTGFDNLKYEIYEGSRKIQTINVNSDTLNYSIPTTANKLKVVGLPEGFKSVYEEYDLNSSKPLVTIEVKAEVVTTGYNPVTKHSSSPTKPLFIGDVMNDFWVQDIRHPERSKRLSEIIEEKKFVFLDFFHTGCSWCTTYTKMYMNTYARDMYKYNKDMTVILVDVQDETEDAIKVYCNNNYINNDFMVCRIKDYVDGMTYDRGILSWFEVNKGYLVATPGHVWLDSEGVIYDMKKCTSEKDFRDMINGYFNALYIGEAEYSHLTNKNNSYNNQMPIPFESLCLTHQNVFDNKRKFII